MKKASGFILSILFPLGCLGEAALAKENPAKDDPVKESQPELETLLETLVVTATRGASLADELIGDLYVMGQDQLETIGHVHIQESLARVPGTWISRGNGQEHLTAIRSPVLTGAGSCGEFLMAEDSVPLRAAGFCNVNQLFEVNTEQAGRIEVWRGPGTVSSTIAIRFLRLDSPFARARASWILCGPSNSNSLFSQ